MRQEKIINLIVTCFKLCKQREIAKYSGKFSKKTYTQHQLITIGVLKIYLNQDYRGITDLLAASEDIRTAINLKEIPHFTTIQKFLNRFNLNVFNLLISAAFIHIIGKRKVIDVAIDGTGFTSSYSSRYYVMRVERETTYLSFMKMSLAVDPESKGVIAVKCRKAPSHDNKDFIPLLKRIKRTVKRKIRYVIADKGYDASKNFYYIEKELKAKAIIPVRWYKSSRAGRNTIRKRRPLEPDKYIYGKRNIAETVFSVIKRRFSGDLRSRLTSIKKKEMMLKTFVYNLCILVNKKMYFLIRGFLQSLFFNLKLLSKIVFRIDF